MRFPYRRSGGHGRVLAAAVCVSLFTLAAAVADEPKACCDEPIDGCGKANAMLGRMWDLESGRELPFQREALSDTDVVSYVLDIELSNFNTSSNTCTIAGSNTITLKSRSPSLTQFTFRLRNQYAVGSVLLNGSTPAGATNLNINTWRIDLDRAYGLDEEVVIRINYSGNSVAAGFGPAITVATKSGDSVPIVATLSEPYYAYTWWPSKDGDLAQPGDNSDKALIDLSFTVPNNMQVPSNGLLDSVTDLPGNRRKYRWVSQYPISTYLVSFAATNYVKWTQTYTHPGGTMPVEFYIYPASNSSSNRAAWEKCIDMLAAFRPIFGEYPFITEKYGIYQFNFGGGMEHQTMTGQGTFSESVTAHELGHQWWGDMITCKTWSDIWLNEGFATYSEALWEERKTGTPNVAALHAAMASRRPFNVAGTVYVYPADITSGGPNRIFNSDLSYRKAGWVLHMLRNVVGEATFFQILADYRAAYAFGAATTDDFTAVVSGTTGQNMSTYFNQWIYQAGAPAYTFGWQSTNVAGQDYLLVNVNQTQTGTNYPSVFVMPIDLRATIGGLPQTLRVSNAARNQWFVVPISGPATALAFDPDTWILRTAATSITYSPGPPKIVATTPAPGSSTTASPTLTQLEVLFHTPVNAATANFSLVGDVVGAQSVSLASGSAVNPAVLDLSSPLVADTYTLTVTSGVTAANSGQALDGEIADPESPASLPSGNGVASGTAVLRFHISLRPGDLNNDAFVDALDLQLLVDVLLGIETDPVFVARSDIDSNGRADGDDIQAFVNLFPGL